MTETGHHHVSSDGTAVLCDCCEHEKMAEIRPLEGLVIKDGRHGRKHVAVVPAREVVSRLAGTTGSAAVLSFVKGLFP